MATLRHGPRPYAACGPPLGVCVSRAGGWSSPFRVPRPLFAASIIVARPNWGVVVSTCSILRGGGGPQVCCAAAGEAFCDSLAFFFFFAGEECEICTGTLNAKKNKTRWLRFKTSLGVQGYDCGENVELNFRKISCHVKLIN